MADPLDPDLYPEELTVYAPAQKVDPTNLNVTPQKVTLVGKVDADLQRQTQAATAAVNSLGIIGMNPGHLFTTVENASKLGDRYVLADELGQYWVIHGPPAVRRTGNRHTKALVTQLRIKPAGIP